MSRSHSAVALLAVLVAGNAFARGGVDPLAIAATALLAPLALVAAARRTGGGPARLPVLPLGLAALTLVVGAQLLPLPPALLAWASPATADLLARQLGPLGAWPSARPLSLDPGATALELAKCAAWTCVAAAAALLAGDRGRRDALLRAIALTGGAVVLATWVARLAGVGSLVEPRFPFVNPNHLAGFLQLSAWPALGFALRARGRARLGWLASFALSASGILLSLSRAGIGALVLGAGIFVALWGRRGDGTLDGTRVPPHPDPLPPLRGGRGRGSGVPLFRGGRGRGSGVPLFRWASGRGSGVVPLAIGTALGLAAFLAFDRIAAELRTVSEASTIEVKLGLWPLAAAMIRDFPLLGIGRGAFETAFPAYKWEPLRLTFTHVENEWLQLPLDLGLPAGLAAIALFAWAFLAQARRPGLSRPVIGAAAGVGALAAHVLFDFSLQLGGVAVPFAILSGVLARELPAVRVGPWALRAGAAAALALGALGLHLHRAHPTAADGDRVAQAPNADAALAAAREVLPWHPADWVPPAAVATKLAGEQRCDEAAPWLERALQRNPTAPELHRAAARCQALTGQTRLAWRSWRLAFLYGDPGALAEAHAAYPAALLDIAPDTPAGLLAAAALLRDDAPRAREAWRRAWESFGEPRALAGLARTTLAAGEAQAALALARRLQALAPLDPAGSAVAAHALRAIGDSDAAVAELERGIARLPGNPELLEALGTFHLQRRRPAQARAAFDAIVARDDRTAVRRKVLLARALEAQERYADALRLLAEVRDAVKDEPWPLELVARVAEKAGRWDDAVEALEAAARRSRGPPGRYEADLARIRAAKTEAWARPVERPGR